MKFDWAKAGKLTAQIMIFIAVMMFHHSQVKRAKVEGFKEGYTACSDFVLKELK